MNRLFLTTFVAFVAVCSARGEVLPPLSAEVREALKTTTQTNHTETKQITSEPITLTVEQIVLLVEQVKNGVVPVEIFIEKIRNGSVPIKIVTQLIESNTLPAETTVRVLTSGAIPIKIVTQLIESNALPSEIIAEVLSSGALPFSVVLEEIRMEKIPMDVLTQLLENHSTPVNISLSALLSDVRLLDAVLTGKMNIDVRVLEALAAVIKSNGEPMVITTDGISIADMTTLIRRLSIDGKLASASPLGLALKNGAENIDALIDRANSRKKNFDKMNRTRVRKSD